MATSRSPVPGSGNRRPIVVPCTNNEDSTTTEVAQIAAAAAAGATLAWVGRAYDSALLQAPVVPLYHLAVDNPEPGRAVAAFSLLPGSHPVLVAATAELAADATTR